jgi:hypothetical protein
MDIEGTNYAKESRLEEFEQEMGPTAVYQDNAGRGTNCTCTVNTIREQSYQKRERYNLYLLFCTILHSVCYKFSCTIVPHNVHFNDHHITFA